MQGVIDFTAITDRWENTPDNRRNLQLQRVHFGKQNEAVYNLLKSGGTITTKTAMLHHGIGDLQGRVRDLIKAGVDIKSEWVEKEGSRYKRYFIDTSKIQ